MGHKGPNADGKVFLGLCFVSFWAFSERGFGRDQIEGHSNICELELLASVFRFW